jgi:hypothetical protein
VKNDQTQAFTVDERHGAWSAAHEVAGALNAGLFARVTSVSCASPGNCAAVGSYTDGAGHPQAFLVTEKNGAWSAAQQVARALNTGGDATANTVSCPSAGNCAAGGAVTDPAGGQAFVVTGSITQPTSRALSLSSAKVAYGQEHSERLSVTVRARYGGIPAGAVAVRIGAATICVIHVTAGQGSCSPGATRLHLGTYYVTASYAGSTGFLGSTAAAKTLTVIPLVLLA